MQRLRINPGTTAMRQIVHKDQLIAIYVPASYGKHGVDFVTKHDATMQVGVLCHPKNTTIGAHMHLPVTRQSHITQEVLVIRKGKVRAHFFDCNENYLESVTLEKDDVLLLVSGGHGFDVLEDSEMIEVKTGPYNADADKRRFVPSFPEFAKAGD